MRGIIFDIQHYAIYDGPGIRTAVYFKGCPLRCIFCHNPESQVLNPEMAYWEERCKRCKTCIKLCPNKALRIENNRITRDKSLCAVCAKCVDACLNQAMEKIGFEISAEEITEQLMRDKIFYDNSGGGATITGGEPTFQKEFLFELLRELKRKGIHIVLETCGAFQDELLEPLIEKVDLFLFDIKQIDSKLHQKATGKDNNLILRNFAQIWKKAGKGRLIPRIPLVPEFNTDKASIDLVLSYLGSLNYSGEVHLLPYHSWAKGKYQRIGRGDSFREIRSLTEDEISNISRAFSDKGYEPLLYG